MLKTGFSVDHRRRRMAAFTKRKFWIAVMLLILVIIGELYAFTLHWEIRAIVFRAHYIAVVEIGLAMMSMFVWINFKTVFAHHPHPHNDNGNDGYVTEVSYAGFSGDRNLKNKSNKLQDVSVATVFSEIFLQKRWHVGKCLLLFYLFLCHISYFTNIVFIGQEPYLIGMLCYTALGSLFQLVLGMFVIKLVGFCGRHCLKKRVFVSSKCKLILAVTYSLMASSYGFFNAASPPTVKNVTVSMKGLPHGLEGFSIVQLTDVHLGPTVGRQKMQQIVDISNQLNADILVLTGDLVDGSVARLKKAAEPLRDIRTKYGKYFITGNHEYYTGDVDNWFSYLKELGFTILHNSNVKLPSKAQPSQQICLAGTDDLQAAKIGYGNHGMDLKKALGTCEKNHPTILLAHQPAAAKLALDSKHRVDLVISGHTHGGQMFPFMIAVYWINPFFAGLYKYGEDSHVYVSMGTQYWGVPMRILTTMEITQLILTRKR